MQDLSEEGFEPDRLPRFSSFCKCDLDGIWDVAPAYYSDRDDLIKCFLCGSIVTCPSDTHWALFVVGPCFGTTLTDKACAEYLDGIFPRGSYLGCFRGCEVTT